MASSSYHHLYGSARWKRLRLQALVRDGWQCRYCGALLSGGRAMTDGAMRAAVVDHVTPHRGDPALFYDLGNLQAVCKQYHDRVKAKAEARGYDAAVDDGGWPLDPSHPAAK